MAESFTIFTVPKALMIIGIISAVSGCATNAPSTHNSGGVNITVSSMQPNLDENPFYQAPKTQPLKMSDIPTEDKKLSFEEARTFDIEVGFGNVQLNFAAINDKAVKNNPAFDKEWYEKLVHTSKTYTGYDDWGREYGADLHTRMEYHLIRDARRLLLTKYKGKGATFSHHLHSKPTMRNIERPALMDNAKGMNDTMIWLKELGFSDDKITEFTFTCMPRTYSKMMYESGSGKESITHRYAGLVYEKFKPISWKYSDGIPHRDIEKSYIETQSYGSRLKLDRKYVPVVMDLNIMKRQGKCEPLKDAMLVDGFQLFYKPPPKEVENGVFETVYVDEPRFEPQLFQNLFSKNYYGELTRVSENGAFSSLRKPEGRSFVMQYDIRKDGLPYMQKEKKGVAKFGNNDAVKTAAIAKAWLGDTNFIHYYNVLDWSIQFKNSFKDIRGGLLDCRINNNEMNLQLGTSKIRRVYNCSVKNNKNKFTNAFVRFLKGPGTNGSLFATVDVEGPDFGGVAFAESKRDDYTNETLFNQNKPMLVSEYIEDTVLKSVPVNTAISYIQKLPDGKVEGVVHVLGYKVVYNLTNMSTWYQQEMSDAYPIDKPLTKWADIHVKSKIAAELEFSQFTGE